MNFLEYNSYLGVLEKKIKETKRRGYKSALAKGSGCKLSYLSQVLKGQVHLTPEHALGLTEFWNLDKIEKEFFLLLVLRDRAGTRSLRQYFTTQIEALRKDNSQITKHIAAEDQVDAEKTNEVLEYYASWHIGAIRVALGVPEFQTVESLSRRFALSATTVEQALLKLKRLGYAERVRDHWVQTKKNVHAPGASFAAVLNHSNWRQRNLVSLQERPSSGMHYTGVSSLSRTDVEKVKEILVESIKATRNVIGPSKEEEIVVLSVDFDIV